MNRKEDMQKIIGILQNAERAENKTPNIPALQQSSALPTDPIEMGRQLMQSGKMQEAESVFKHVLMKDSMNTQAYFNLGLIYYSSKQMGEAEYFWRKAVSIDSTYTDAFNNLAICLAQQGKNAEAEIVLKKIISSNPNYLDGYFNMANFYARNGREKDALVYVRQLKKRGISKEQFEQRGIKLSPELEKVFDR